MLLQSFIRALIRVNFFTISQAACSSSTRDMQLVAAVTTLIRPKKPAGESSVTVSSSPKDSQTLAHGQQPTTMTASRGDTAPDRYRDGAMVKSVRIQGVSG
jgi:hypothetical protein